MTEYEPIYEFGNDSPVAWVSTTNGELLTSDPGISDEEFESYRQHLLDVAVPAVANRAAVPWWKRRSRRLV